MGDMKNSRQGISSLIALIAILLAGAGSSGATYLVLSPGLSPETIVGPEGLAGPIGERGPAGPQGIQGEQGLPGEDGARGPQGLQGLSGPAGARGADGQVGLPGPIGPRGLQGPQGLAGPPGEPGIPGVQGEIGVQGPPGILGTYIRSFEFTITGGGLNTIMVSCLPNDVVLTGGVRYVSPINADSEKALFSSFPADIDTWVWHFGAQNDDVDAAFSVVCAEMSE